MDGKLSVIEEWLLTPVVLFVVFGVFFPAEQYFGGPVAPGSVPPAIPWAPSGTMIVGFGAAVILILIVRSFSSVVGAIRSWWPLFVFVGWAYVTALWAEDLGTSITRTDRLLLVTLYGVYMASCLDQQSLVRFLSRSLLIAIGASLAMCLARPDLSLTADLRGAWRGAFIQKNFFGSVAAAGVLVGGYALAARAIARPLAFGLLIGSAVSIALSNSMVAAIALFVGASGGIYLSIAAMGSPQSRVVAILGAALGLAIILLALSASGAGADLIGRDATLTGRVSIWRFADTMIDMRPFWGFGHGAWSMPEFQKLVLAQLGYQVPHAHSTWRDYRLQLGVPGLGIAIAMWAIALKRAAHAVLVSRTPDHLLWVSMLTVTFLKTYGETLMIDPLYAEMFWFSIAFTRLGITVSGRATATVGSLQANGPQAIQP